MIFMKPNSYLTISLHSDSLLSTFHFRKITIFISKHFYKWNYWLQEFTTRKKYDAWTSRAAQNNCALESSGEATQVVYNL